MVTAPPSEQSAEGEVQQFLTLPGEVKIYISAVYHSSYAFFLLCPHAAPEYEGKILVFEHPLPDLRSSRSPYSDVAATAPPAVVTLTICPISRLSDTPPPPVPTKTLEALSSSP